MKLFISWSGDSSEELARYLDGWLRRMAIGVIPWVSSLDIQAGRSWRQELDQGLSDSGLGLFVLTRNTQSTPFVCFEAGALASRRIAVIPYLIDLTPAELAPVFSEFQSKPANRPGTWQLVQELHAHSTESTKLRTDQLPNHFAILWPELERRLGEAVRLVKAASRTLGFSEVIEAIGYVRQELRSLAVSSRSGEPISAETDRRHRDILYWGANELIRRYISAMVNYLNMEEHIPSGSIDALSASTLEHALAVLTKDSQTDVKDRDLLTFAKSQLESHFNVLHDMRRIDDETFQRAWHKIDSAWAPQ